MKKTSKNYPHASLSIACLFALGVIASPSVADLDKLVKECADCHEKDGNATDGETPSIAGMSKVYFTDSMAAYKSGARPAKKLKDKKKDMKDVVKELSDADIEALAGYFAKQKFKPLKQEYNAEYAKLGKKLHKKYCDKCHSNGGSSSEDDAGILAGQPISYLTYSMENYANGKREMGKKMAKKFDAMHEKDGDEGIVHLIHYYASQQ
jgi:sulfide dehydrogenase cytochrome subunit